jgi:hypothetical protein
VTGEYRTLRAIQRPAPPIRTPSAAAPFGHVA